MTPAVDDAPQVTVKLPSESEEGTLMEVGEITVSLAAAQLLTLVMLPAGS